MRSLLVLVVPVLLSFGVMACGEDESEPTPSTQQSREQSSGLVAAGGACDSDDDCADGLTCAVATTRTIGVKGEPMMDPCETDPKGCGQTKGKPTTDPAPTPSSPSSTPTGAPANDPATNPAPAPAPLAKRVCTSR